MYKLTNTTTILRISDNAFIPKDKDNTDYVEYLNWTAKGGIPVPADSIPTLTYIQLREREYPPANVQFELIFDSGIPGWKAVIQAIKDKYPKPL